MPPMDDVQKSRRAEFTVHHSSSIVVSMAQWIDVDAAAKGVEFDRRLAGVGSPSVSRHDRGWAPGFGSKGNFRIPDHFAFYGLRNQFKRSGWRSEDIHVAVPGGKLIVGGGNEVAFKDNLARGGAGAQ